MEQLLDENVIGKTSLKFAGFWERFLAAFIDGIIIGIPNYIVVYALSSIPGLGNIIGLAIGIGYYVYFESSEKMATIGKTAMGLKVVNESDHDRITAGTAVKRYFSKILSTIILLIGYFMMLFNDKKQCLHDKIAGTYVVKA